MMCIIMFTSKKKRRQSLGVPNQKREKQVVHSYKKSLFSKLFTSSCRTYILCSRHAFQQLQFLQTNDCVATSSERCFTTSSSRNRVNIPKRTMPELYTRNNGALWLRAQNISPANGWQTNGAGTNKNGNKSRRCVVCSSCFYRVFGGMNFLFLRARVMRVVCYSFSRHFGNSRSSGRRTFSCESTAKRSLCAYYQRLVFTRVFTRCRDYKLHQTGLSVWHSSVVGTRQEGKKRNMNIQLRADFPDKQRANQVIILS